MPPSRQASSPSTSQIQDKVISWLKSLPSPNTQNTIEDGQTHKYHPVDTNANSSHDSANDSMTVHPALSTNPSLSHDEVGKINGDSQSLNSNGSRSSIPSMVSSDGSYSDSERSSFDGNLSNQQ